MKSGGTFGSADSRPLTKRGVFGIPMGMPYFCAAGPLIWLQMLECAPVRCRSPHPPAWQSISTGLPFFGFL